MNNTNPSQPPVKTTPTNLTSKPSEFWTVFLLSLFLGIFGAHRFYARKFKSGAIQLVTLGFCGIWSLVDVVTILLSKFKNSAGVLYRNPKPKVSWGIFAAVCILGIISGANENQTSGAGGGSGSSSSSSRSSWGSSDEKRLVGTYESAEPPYVLRLSYGGSVSMQNLQSNDRHDGKWFIKDGSLVTVWDSNGSETTYDINSDGSFKSSHGILFVKTQQ